MLRFMFGVILKTRLHNIMSQDLPSPLKLSRTDTVSSQATSSFNRQVWMLADEDSYALVRDFCFKNRIPSTYQGPIVIEDEIFIIEDIDDDE